ncbi:CFEM domain-containing protein [Purpureocillium lilacinum]|uniref:CFEM domain-containing protein n=1 Tax=Purpureocillium lilacinum TaxID=33203 RepID=A0A179FL28_PURLI|nr:CFEM domain-containing protein [Purpureocillium lilacinum]
MAQCGQPVLNRSGELVAISLGMYIVAAMFVMIRLGYKVFVIRIHFNMDDWFVLASAVATAPAIFVNVFGTTVNGLGQDIWNLPPHKISASIKYFWIDICLYFLDTTLTKLSIISFYIRTFPSSNVQRLLWATFTITGAWGTAFVLVGIFQCQPISHFWTQWDGLQTGQCASPDGIGWSNAISNIVLDIWILSIPLSQLRRLQLNVKKKIGVAIMFCLGTL